MQREGICREMKLRGHYEKPSVRRVREKAEAIRRARKLARKKLQREGLLPMKPRAVPGAGRPRAHSSLLIFEHRPESKVAASVREGRDGENPMRPLRRSHCRLSQILCAGWHSENRPLSRRSIGTDAGTH